MNNLKIVYKKPTEYDNSTISLASSGVYTDSDIDLNIKDEKHNDVENKLENNNIKIDSNKTDNYNKLNKIDTNMVDNINYEINEEQINRIVLLLKNKLLNYNEKTEIIKYIDNFFELNKFSNEEKNKILTRLNELIIKDVKVPEIILPEKVINSSDNNKDYSNNNNEKITNPIEKTSKILGLDISLWGILCVIIVLVFLYIRKNKL